MDTFLIVLVTYVFLKIQSARCPEAWGKPWKRERLQISAHIKQFSCSSFTCASQGSVEGSHEVVVVFLNCATEIWVPDLGEGGSCLPLQAGNGMWFGIRCLWFDGFSGSIFGCLCMVLVSVWWSWFVLSLFYSCWRWRADCNAWPRKVWTLCNNKILFEFLLTSGWLLHRY